MARRLVTSEALLCDWHSALSNRQDIEATTERIIANGKTIDLCGFCALVWDFCGPRMDEIKEMIQPHVLDVLSRSARASKSKTPEPLQLPMAEENTTQPTTPPPADDEKPPLPKHKRGAKIPGVEQVICPMEHRPGTAQPYWVRFRDRGSHAKGSHHKLGPEIPYELPPSDDPDAFTLTVKCFDHKVCADAGGYGFKDENGLRCHRIKSKSWEKAKVPAA